MVSITGPFLHVLQAEKVVRFSGLCAVEALERNV